MFNAPSSQDRHTPSGMRKRELCLRTTRVPKLAVGEVSRGRPSVLKAWKPRSSDKQPSSIIKTAMSAIILESTDDRQIPKFILDIAMTTETSSLTSKPVPFLKRFAAMEAVTFESKPLNGSSRHIKKRQRSSRRSLALLKTK
ncbi:stage II sporulation E, putative [Babesia ovata]|uniref:Stage II sporulation E, putative n=1 Tax=Babesia ovata TaxID=189622 RepID=A0A2H6K7T3_9APIC|nr:stage II sporulation E, putative [Babesia ovata]GBE59057.1 stage II sporulation E, putative [Babesia ovata]